MNAPKSPILDKIEVPQKVIERWQVTANLLAGSKTNRRFGDAGLAIPSRIDEAMGGAITAASTLGKRCPGSTGSLPANFFLH